MHVRVPNALLEAEIITLRAIALKLNIRDLSRRSGLFAEIITLRAIALKRRGEFAAKAAKRQRS